MPSTLFPLELPDDAAVLLHPSCVQTLKTMMVFLRQKKQVCIHSLMLLLTIAARVYIATDRTITTVAHSLSIGLASFPGSTAQLFTMCEKSWAVEPGNEAILDYSALGHPIAMVTELVHVYPLRKLTRAILSPLK